MAKNSILFLCAFLYVGFAPVDQSKSYAYRHSNSEYGYSVLIPKGLKTRTDPPPLPQHGFRISLSTEAGCFIWVDGSYNTFDWVNLQEAVDSHLEWLKQEGTDYVKIRESSVRLGRLQALRSIVRYKSSTTGKWMLQDLVLALRERKSEVGILYTCGLKTLESRYPKDKELFEKIIKSWELRSLPH